MKTKEELNEIKEEVEKLDTKLHELTEEELEQVTGGNNGPGALPDDGNKFVVVGGDLKDKPNGVVGPGGGGN